ncbi:microsomal glutathione S-transferase 2-like [Mya arenaria]|uniref:microsomal glutathione S-transferase 2-like n=1 Tax=Mya arenaria TaxID=6604 RepID=UPI0022E91B08|nr:microsomal glutathione S-transferase 2-like [Mya arenaria]XP_052792888.1 microsomal glutathione S-transferase 2-like [Mya arenaria]
MPGIETKDFIWVGVVAIGHGIQLVRDASEVGKYRRKYKISPPIMDGPPDFLRALRAQQNNIEFGIPFQITLWTAAIFANQVPAAILGTIYLYARRNYSKGYIEAADKRVTPFWQSIWALKGLVVVGVAGIVNTGLREYAGLDLVARLREVAF